MCRPTCFTILILTLFTFSNNAIALNILAIVSLPLRSHYMAFQTLFRELAVRGHSVTVMNNYPDHNPPPNLKFVDMSQMNNTAGYFSPLETYENFDSTYLHLYNFYIHYDYSAPSARRDCENFFTNENVKAHYAWKIKYDVIFVEQFMGDCGLAYAGVMYDAPIIGITSHVMLPLAYPRMGIPFDFSRSAFYFSKAGPNPSTYHKLESLLMNFVYNYVLRWRTQSHMQQVFDRYLPGNGLDVEKVARERMRMMFVYQHHSLTGARLLAPQVLEIGGMHIGKLKPIPEALEKFLSTADQGAIYVSFGSNLKASTMSPAKREQFLEAFRRIPQKVIWKYENASFPPGNEDVYGDDWFPQLDVLCHPKILGFVSHGGMLSLSEAAHCGKPVLVVPFFGDQFSNAASAEYIGLGKVLQFDRLNAVNLAEGIKQLTSQRMQENAKVISKQWHDRPQSVLDSAIYWTEYVARHSSSPPSLPSRQASWFDTLLIDVVAVVLLIILVIYLILKVILLNLLRYCLRKLFCKQKSKVD